jgi:predicted MPP superfamily phosphohydrolase
VFRIAADVPADVVVFTGDLLDREELIDWVAKTFGGLSAPLGCHFILGNHDARLGNTEEIRSRLEGLGWRGVAGKVRVIDYLDQRLALCGSEVPWMGKQPDVAAVPEDAFRLFLSHTPDNIGWARRNAIDLMLSGHNHGGQVRLPLFGPVYSPSRYGARYASGAFWESPTLLYVSRGISGKHPLRWNCLPELTRLVLRPAVCRSVKNERLRAVDASR